jgi:hypothetical protein
MLSPTTDIYQILISEVCKKLDIPLIVEAIRLPRVVLTRALREWVDPLIWRRGDCDEISHSVYRMVGSRPMSIPALENDDTNPTRGLFITSPTKIRY